MYLDARSIVFRIPEEISSEISSLIVPISNGIDWLQKGRPETGPKDTIVVVGPGQHGLGCVVAAKQAGASEIIVVGQSRDSNRLEVARTLGANHTIRADFEDPVLRVRDLTSDLLADTVLNVTDNSPESFLTSINMARRGGTVVMSGYSHSVLNNFYPDIVIEKALSIKGVRGRELRSVNEALSLMKENRFPLGLLCSHKFSLEETDLALRTFARQNTDNSIHVSIVPKN
jgi:threonine dehydrogenase-like Zn-dependent dehydrogenase